MVSSHSATRVGEVISLPEQDLSIEVLDVQDDHVKLRITGPFSAELEGEDDFNFQEPIVFLESAG
jgi:hypothetical protein